MKVLLFMLLLLWNDKKGAHAQAGKQTYCVDIPPSFLIVVVDCNRRNERDGVVVRIKY